MASAMNEPKILDVRSLVPAEQQRAVLATYDRLGIGARFVLVDNRDPRPLYRSFDTQRHGRFSWRYLQQGPAVWRVEIGRPDPSQRGVR